MQLANARFDQYAADSFRRRAAMRITAALSAALLMLGLLLPDRFADRDLDRVAGAELVALDPDLAFISDASGISVLLLAAIACALP